MHCACTHDLVVGWGFYAISVNYLRYLCGLFMLFAKKRQNRNLWLASHAGGWLLDREFD
jgi:hypothetical protein